MRKMLCALPAAACAILVLLAWNWGHRQADAAAFDRRRVLLLEAENQRLRGLLGAQESQRSAAANVTQRAEIARAVEGIRGLRFQKPVTYDVLTRAGIKRTIEQKLAEQFTDAEIKNAGVGLAALGLLPRDYPLKEKYIELLGEQVAAFYDQHQHKLFMFEDAPLSNASNRIVLAHELTHALQDQHFGLLKLPLEIKNNDDVALASSALVEGEATLVMSQYLLENLSLSGVSQSLSSAFTQNLEQLQSAPRYLRETLMFPYLRGQEFCTALLARGGWEAISAAYQELPSSTAQILHPEKYLAEPREEPVRIVFGRSTWQGEPPLADNVLGELGTRILLSEQIDAKAADRAAEGWRGDRYLVFKNGDALVWVSTWDTADDANEFSAAMEKALAKRYSATFSTGDAPRPARAADSPHVLRIIPISPTEVGVLDAREKSDLPALEEIIFSAQISALRSE